MSRKLRALDLYCRAGGVSVGLARAGFEVVGVDILDMRGRHRGGEFVQGDALTHPLEGFDFIWASPPCQAHTVLRSLTKGKEYPDLIPATRERLSGCGIPWVIENVPGAPLEGDLLVLCGTMFGLQTPDGSAEIRRHRHFESSFPIVSPGPCRHGGRAVSVTGNTPQTNAVRNQVRETFSVEDVRAAMGIDWMSMRDLSQAIPPVYVEWIGRAAITFITDGRCPGVQKSLLEDW